MKRRRIHDRGQHADKNPLDGVAKLAVGPQWRPGDHLEVLRAGTAYHSGSAVQVIGTAFRQHDSGLLVPATYRDPSPVDYARVYMTLAEYTDVDPREVATWILTRYPTHDLLLALVALLRMASEPGRMDEVLATYTPTLATPLRTRLEAAVATDRFVFLARQPILDAILLTLGNDREPADSTPDYPVDLAAVMLTHSVAAKLGESAHPPYEDGDAVGDWPWPMIMFLVQNAYFNHTDDPAAQLNRYHRLWRDYACQTKTYVPSPPACEQIENALGLSLVEFMALAYALFSHAFAWQPGKPMLVSRDLGLPAIPPEKIDAFVRAVGLPLDEHRKRAAEARTEWDFISLERWPVVDLGEVGLLVLDAQFMLERITTSLWRYPEDASGRTLVQWRQFYAEAIELMIEDQLRLLAPKNLDTMDAQFFTEEDFKAAYSGKACDAAICYGDDWCLFEVVSTRMSLAARELGDRDAFIEDTNRIVLKKARQLDDTATRLLAGLSSTFSGVPAAAKRVFPVVVSLDEYPIFPPTVRLIASLLETEALLSDSRTRPLAVLGPAELDLLEALVEQGHSLVEVLAGWQASSLTEAPLKNYIDSRWGLSVAGRPNRIDDEFEEVFDPSFEQLRIWGANDTAEGPDAA